MRSDALANECFAPCWGEPSSAGSGAWPAHPLHEPPVMPLRIDRAVGTIGPVVVAVVVGRGFVCDRRARGARVFAVRVGVVDEEAERLGHCAVDRLWAAAWHRRSTLAFRVRAADHDQAIPERQFGVHDLACVAFDLEHDLEPERFADPIDRGRWVVVEDRAGNPGPTRRGGLLRLRFVAHGRHLPCVCHRTRARSRLAELRLGFAALEAVLGAGGVAGGHLLC